MSLINHIDETLAHRLQGNSLRNELGEKVEVALAVIHGYRNGFEDERDDETRKHVGD
jgi:hypothetical protein